MKRVIVGLIFLMTSFSAMCYSSQPPVFECKTEDSVWRIERESGRDAFAFFYNDRLVAFRHLELVDGHFLTNHYDLNLELSKKGEEWQGHLEGRLMGKRWYFMGLVCKGEPRPER